MNYKVAKRKVIIKNMIGLAVAVPAIVSTAISFLKILYYRIDDGSQIGGVFSRPFKQFVAWIYENTRFLNLFWEHSPTPDQMHLSDPNNFYFLVIYMLFFVGLAFLASGKKLRVRLTKINQKIENQLIEESIKGDSARTREQIEQSTEIPSYSIFRQLHQLYLAPIVTAVIGAIIVKVVGV